MINNSKKKLYLKKVNLQKLRQRLTKPNTFEYKKYLSFIYIIKKTTLSIHVFFLCLNLSN